MLIDEKKWQMKAIEQLEIYLVGGAVRDTILGLEVKDEDFVVVGSSPAEMSSLGFLPIGKDFPVFLHPSTKSEYALARTERKTAVGHKGFEFYTNPEVTLTQDLKRRDFTINAIAMDQDGKFIDPFGGIRDLENKVIRHISPAFTEDPLRVFRAARFAARFKFKISTKTMKMMTEIVARGETKYLSFERVWDELSKGLMEKYPSEMIRALLKCNVFVHLFKGITKQKDGESYPSIHLKSLIASLNYLALKNFPLHIRFGVLINKILEDNYPNCFNQSETLEKFFSLFPLPKRYRDFTVVLNRFTNNISNIKSEDKPKILEIIESADGIRRPERFEKIVTAYKALDLFSHARQSKSSVCSTLLTSAKHLREIDLSAYLKQHKGKKLVKDLVREYRIKKLKDF